MEAGVIPKPQYYQRHQGSYRRLKRAVRIHADTPSAEGAQRLARYLDLDAGQVMLGPSDANEVDGIRLQVRPSSSDTEEGYHLQVTTAGVRLVGTGGAGLFYGIQTLRQLLGMNGSPRADSATIEWPCVEVRDFPRFDWRGIMLDVSRHFMPVPFIKRLLDAMALHKLNRFHWHLTDDQGWRLESRAFPRLTEVGAVRVSSPQKGHPEQDDGTPYGPYFYTGEEVREVVAYAAERQITIIPEIDMPGHVKALLAAYPEWGCTGGPYAVRTSWGVEEEVLCVGHEPVYAFIERLLDEVFALFPGPYIHLGGDEVPTHRWADCPRCRKRMQLEGMKSPTELQGYFTRRLVALAAQRGRTVIGWDETLDHQCPPSVIIMSWRGEKGGHQAAKAGLNAIMTPHTHCYFDYAQSNAPDEPEAIGTEITSLEQIYSYEPIPDGLTAEEERRLLGVQGNAWTEYMWTEEDVEYKVFPRACALAERAWSAPDVDYEDFIARLQNHLYRLDQLGLNYRRLTPRAARPHPVEGGESGPI